MAMKLICDVCQKPVEARGDVVVRGNGDFSTTNAGVYLEGSFRVVRDGEGEPADVCVGCVAKVLLMSDVSVRDGAKALDARSR